MTKVCIEGTQKECLEGQQKMRPPQKGVVKRNSSCPLCAQPYQCLSVDNHKRSLISFSYFFSFYQNTRTIAYCQTIYLMLVFSKIKLY